MALGAFFGLVQVKRSGVHHAVAKWLMIHDLQQIIQSNREDSARKLWRCHSASSEVQWTHV